MSHRFFLDSEILDDQAILTGDQAHHAIQVMRFGLGDQVRLFNGRGTEYVASIVAVDKKQLVLAIESTDQTLSPFSMHLSIAVSLPKGDRQKFLIEKLVELGVDRLIPLKTSRSVAVANAKVVERFRRNVIEASKQCGRNFLMEIESDHTIDGLIGENLSPGLRIVADPVAGVSLSQVMADLKSTPDRIVVAIGPEGGFSDNETRQLLDANWIVAGLGPTILRIETAAIAAASLLRIT